MSMSQLIQLFIRGFKGSTMTIDIHKDALVGDLFRKLKDKTGLDPTQYKLIYTSKTLDYGQHKDKHLSDFHLENLSNLVMVTQLPGGSEKVLDDDVEVTDLPDMITWDDDADNKRAKMPCGHAITPESLTLYCRSLLDANKYRFLCPWVDPNDSTKGCTAEWQYVIVRRLAVLTEAEKTEFEKKISENYLRRAINIQECPRCHSYCQRKSNKDRRVVCLICSAEAPDFHFCWFCLGTWKTAGIDRCGNDACSGKDPRLKILENAKEKVIVGVQGVPARRACPKCGMLIEHVAKCKHMTCPCGQDFCFICLKPKQNNRWQCGAFNEKCTVAPRQKELPN